MKKLSIVLAILFFCASGVFADEIVNTANQDIVVEDNKAVFTIQKQPNDENSMQKQDVKRNWFCIVIQINGKIKDFDITNSDNK